MLASVSQDTDVASILARVEARDDLGLLAATALVMSIGPAFVDAGLLSIFMGLVFFCLFGAFFMLWGAQRARSRRDLGPRDRRLGFLRYAIFFAAGAAFFAALFAIDLVALVLLIWSMV